MWERIIRTIASQSVYFYNPSSVGTQYLIMYTCRMSRTDINCPIATSSTFTEPSIVIENYTLG